MKKITFKLLPLTMALLLCTGFFAKAGDDQPFQYLYLIKFKDKSLNYVRKDKPETYLTPKALERREKYGIPIDSMDYPVSTSYIESVRTKGLQILYPTRWMNGIVVSTDEHDKARSCLMLFYVDKVYYLGKQRASGSNGQSNAVKGDTAAAKPVTTEITMQDDLRKNYANGYDQLNMLNGIELHRSGYTGKGISIAVFDAGFYGVNTNPVFRNISEQVVYTWDFVSMEANVYNDDSHGAHVFSCMAASQEETMIGSAPDASYYLFRTESAKYEYLYEEIHWIRAAEVADSLGVDIINSSLGYTYFDDREMDHTWDDLGGETWISQGAAIAAGKGILIVNAAGNEGTGKWKYVNPPADIPEVLAVGAVQLDGEHVNFSSYGHPSLVGVKPDICGPGFAVSTTTSSGKITHGNGTSYASPIVCGLAACLLQANPEALPAEIITAIINSADRRLSPDSAYGYGVPDFMLANAMLKLHANPGFIVVRDNDQISKTNKGLLYVPDGDTYKMSFYIPGKFLIFHTKKRKINVSGLVLPTGYAVVSIPLEYADIQQIGVKAKVDTGQKRVKVKQILSR